MGMKPTDRSLSATIDKNLYQKMESLAKKEFGSVNKLCNALISYIVDNPNTIYDIKIYLAKKNLSDLLKSNPDNNSEP